MKDNVCIDIGESDCRIVETHFVNVTINAPKPNGGTEKVTTRIMMYKMECDSVLDEKVKRVKAWATNSVNIGGIAPLICAPCGEFDHFTDGKSRITAAINQTLARIIEEARSAALRQRLGDLGEPRPR